MQYFAHVVDGAVREVVTLPDDVAVSDCFQAEFAAQLAPCDASVEQGWVPSGSGFAPTPAPALTSAELSAYASAKAEALLATVSAYTAGSTTIHSDRANSTRADWIALQQWATDNPGDTKVWVTNALAVESLPSAAVGPIALAVGTDALTIYQVLGETLTAIGAATITTAAQIDAAPWPTSHA